MNKFYEKTQKVVAIAESIAFDLGHSSVGTEHLLLALLKIKESKLRVILERYDVGYDEIKNDLLSLFDSKDTQPFYMEYTTSLKAIIDKSYIDCKKFNEEKVSVDVLTYSLLNYQDCLAFELLMSRDINIKKVKDEIKQNIKKISELDSIEDLVNLNNKVLKNHENVVGRDKEIKELIECLQRKQKPNALLVGEPGVGKTAIVHHLAYLLATNQLQNELKDKVIYELDISSVVAGTKYRGEFEEKLKKIIKKVKKDQHAIIFIDEIHNIIGAGGAEGAIDAANILKPYLTRGEIQCIGATTYDEYVKIVEKEKALNRRYQLIMISEPDLNMNINIIKEVKKNYENFHKIIIDEKIIKPLIKYCTTYIPNKYFPDKALDVLDYACVRCSNNNKEIVEEVDIVEVIEDLYNVKILKNSKAKDLKEMLESKIIGQESAIERVVENISNIEKGLVEDNRPLSVMMLVGPTGVGKTQTAKLVAKSYFGDENKIIKLDMSEYMDQSSVTKLIGASPGYVGFEMSSGIVDFIKKNPYCVVLLDEIEKAHRDVLDIFLNIFDEGYFMDANKRKVSFINTIIILTSNLGFSEELFHKKSIGFLDRKANNEIESAIKKYFRPEFINRLDEIIHFESLNKKTCKELSYRYIKEYSEKFEEKIEISDKILENLANDSEVVRYGARGIRREVKKIISEEINKERRCILK